MFHLDEEDTDDEDDESADQSYPVSIRASKPSRRYQVFPPHTTRSQFSASAALSSKRLGSMSELVALDRPIRSGSLHDGTAGQLNENVGPLYAQLYDITVKNDTFLPSAVHDQIRSAAGRYHRTLG